MFEKILTILKHHNATLVAVSKTKSPEQIMEIYNKGHLIFGENRVQELVQKYEDLPKDISWHLIGHLQTNKVKYIAGFVKLIHSVDSYKLLKEINKEAEKQNKIIDCLLQVRIANEETKFGMTFEDTEAISNNQELANLKNIRITGLMGMATFTQDEAQIRREFRQLKSFFDQLKKDYFKVSPWFKEISMGMSGDYEIALEEGSTMVRIGSLIFGER